MSARVRPSQIPLRQRLTLWYTLSMGLILLLFAAFLPLEGLGRLSLYNWLLPGRQRLPYGENPAESDGES